MLTIRTAKPQELSAIQEFYTSLIDAMQDAEYKPRWRRGLYPAGDFLAQALKKGDVYVGEKDGRIVSSMVVNQEYNEAYNTVPWSVEAADSELYIVHALGVHPDYAGRGIAKQMIAKTFEIGRARGIKTIRLDVLVGNVPAEKVYVKMGFCNCGTVQMFYEDTGWESFKAMDYVL